MLVWLKCTADVAGDAKAVLIAARSAAPVASPECGIVVGVVYPIVCAVPVDTAVLPAVVVPLPSLTVPEPPLAEATPVLAFTVMVVLSGLIPPSVVGCAMGSV